MDTSVVLFIAGVIISIIGWFTNRKMTDLENADKSHTAQIFAQNQIIASLKEEKSALELRIAENYIKRSEIKDFMMEIKSELKEISSKIDGKADKH
jgi:hypothetical protein